MTEEKTSKNSLTACSTPEMIKIAEDLQIDFQVVLTKHMIIWNLIREGGWKKKYGKTTYFTLRKWLRMDIKKKQKKGGDTHVL